MSTTPKEFAIMFLLTAGLGVYVGMFIAEANTMYQCEKDRAVAITGLLWKPGIKYTCTRTIQDSAAKKGYPA